MNDIQVTAQATAQATVQAIAQATAVDTSAQPDAAPNAAPTAGAHKPFDASARFFDDFAVVIVLPDVVLRPATTAATPPQPTDVYHVRPPAEWSRHMGGAVACGAQLKLLDDAIQRAIPLARLALSRPIEDADNTVEYTFDEADAATACRAARLGRDDESPHARSSKASLLIALVDAYPAQGGCFGGVLVHSTECGDYAASDDWPWAMRLVNELVPAVVVEWATDHLKLATALTAGRTAEAHCAPMGSCSGATSNARDATGA